MVYLRSAFFAAPLADSLRSMENEFSFGQPLLCLKIVRVAAVPNLPQFIPFLLFPLGMPLMIFLPKPARNILIEKGDFLSI